MCILLILQLVGAQFTSSLTFHYPTQQDTIAEFSFVNTHNLDLKQMTQPISLFPRSFLENLHLHGNVSSVYISTTQGTMEEWNAPQHGVLIISNDGANQKIMLNQLSEIFRIAKYFMLLDETYFYRFDGKGSEIEFMGFEQDGIQFNQVLLSQDPTDNICIDTIAYILKYMGCNGKQGIAQLIDQNLIFKSSYLSLQAKFSYDHNTKIAKQKIVLLARFPSQKLSSILRIDPNSPIKSCPDFIKETIQHSNRDQVFDMHQAQSLRLGQLSKRVEDSLMVPYTPLIQQVRFCKGTWYSFRSGIHQQITAMVDGYVVVYLYFPREFIPKYYTLQINLPLMEKQFIFQKDIKMIIISGNIKQNQTLTIEIEFEKIIKSFEEYPHDPERGHDLISTPIIFRTSNQNVLFLTSHQVTKQPYPDFSMPFNILTYSSLVLGYYFLQILGMAVDKFVLNKPEKGSLAQRLLRKVFSYF